uniref:Uncharacterized protein n=1 Tax=Hyaloperonospora arabidopsidis (strain Emoy2) TaxID=559515 RepID=M4C1Z7_HYAAE
MKGLFILSGTARERRRVGPRPITRVQSSSAISNSTRPTSGRQSGDRPPVSGHGGGDRQGLGTNLVDSVLHLLRHPMGIAEPLGAQSRGNNRQPSEIRTTTNTVSTATSCSGQGTQVQPRRGRLYFFRLAAELFFTPVSPRQITQYDPGRQLTPPVGVLERPETFQQSCKP